jgi:hypothetical protein
MAARKPYRGRGIVPLEEGDSASAARARVEHEPCCGRPGYVKHSGRPDPRRALRAAAVPLREGTVKTSLPKLQRQVSTFPQNRSRVSYPYSYRTAVTGSMREARRAGK